MPALAKTPVHLPHPPLFVLEHVRVPVEDDQAYYGEPYYNGTDEADYKVSHGFPHFGWLMTLGLKGVLGLVAEL